MRSYVWSLIATVGLCGATSQVQAGDFIYSPYVYPSGSPAVFGARGPVGVGGWGGYEPAVSTFHSSTLTTTVMSSILVPVVGVVEPVAPVPVIVPAPVLLPMVGYGDFGSHHTVTRIRVTPHRTRIVNRGW